MTRFPIIRLELEGVRERVVHAIGAHEEEVKAATQEAVRRAIDSYDFEAEVQREANHALRAAVTASVEHYFKYGEGRKLVQAVVDKALGVENE